eukprot:330924_1
MDGFFSDDDNQSLILDEEKEIRMSLKELMKMFKLKTNDELYEYYNKELNIEYANDLVNYLPTIITQPEKFKSTKTRMLLTKMSKYVMNKVLSNQWNGNKANEWMELETNTVTYTFSPPPPPINKIMDVKNDYIKSENIYFENEIEKKNRMEINGDEKVFIDKIIKLNTNVNINIRMEQLPDIDNKSKEHHVVICGVVFYDKNSNELDIIYISERCIIYRNESYLNMLSLSNHIMLDNDSEICININYKYNETKVKFSHLDKGKFYDNNEREIILNDLICENECFAKIFIHQFYGKGIYEIYEILPIQMESIKKSNNDIIINETKKK